MARRVEKPMGRPTACTEAVTEKVCQALAVGASDRDAAEFAGITADSFRNWLKRAEQGEEPFATFSAKVRQARAGLRVGLAAKVIQAAKADAKFAHKVLLTLPGTDWGRLERVEQSGPGGAPMQVEDARGELARLLGEPAGPAEGGEPEA